MPVDAAAPAPRTLAALSPSSASEPRPAAPPVGRTPPPATRTVNRDTFETATKKAPAELRQVAGSDAARAVRVKGFVVEGPSAFTPGLAEKVTANQTLTRAALSFTYQQPATLGLPKLTGADLEALTRPGPGGEAPKLQAGDFIVTGRDAKGTHLAIYVGSDAKTGKPTLIHAMATQYENMNAAWNAFEVGRLLTTGHEKTGVIKEGLAEYFDRAGQDSAYVVRDPKMTAAMRERGLERLQTLLGTPYDYDLRLGTDALYCSETAVEFLKAAYEGSGQPLPWIGTARVDEARLGGLAAINQWVARPENFGASPDLQLTATVGKGDAAYKAVNEKYVSGAGREH